MKGDLNSLAVICRKSILKKAVDRNRLRRVYKACFNDLKEALPQGMYVAVVKRGVVSVDRRHQYQEVSKEWLVLIKSL
jgi:ribonuclease P protein component